MPSLRHASLRADAELDELPPRTPWRQQLRGSVLGARPAPATETTGPPDRPASPLPRFAQRWPVVDALRRNPAAIAGVAVLLLIVGIAVFADALCPGDPLDIVAEPLIRPFTDRDHALGTDALGRDIAAGLAHGARVSLWVGLTAAGVGTAIGTLIGAAAGYFGGRVDKALTWLIEIFQTTPAFLLVVVIVSIVQPSIETIAVVIGLTSWDTVARLVRAQFRALVGSDFVLAARSIGFGHGWIVFREILPNALPPIVVTASVMVAGAVLMESSLSFLGVGDPNKVSWGTMIGAGRDMLRSAPYLTVLPGFALVAMVFGLNLVGDALIDATNPRLRRRLP